MRTTHATTIIQAGDKENVMPGKARAVINFRILPGQTIEGVKQQLIQTLDEPRITVRLLPDQTAPSDVSPDQGAAWDAIVKSIHQTYKNVVTAPALVIAGTDCKHYTAISANIYRFVPLRLNSQNLEGIHGSDEKIALRNYQEAIGYYRLLFSNI
jgi:carboxypeptidase PM20D1